MAGKKYDGDKPPVWEGLVAYFAQALEEVSRVSGFGAKKYNVPFNEQNWAKVENGYNRYTNAMLRHVVAGGRGEECDPESGLLHDAHAAWDALARLELKLRGQG